MGFKTTGQENEEKERERKNNILRLEEEPAEGKKIEVIARKIFEYYRGNDIARSFVGEIKYSMRNAGYPISDEEALRVMQFLLDKGCFRVETSSDPDETISDRHAIMILYFKNDYPEETSEVSDKKAVK